MAIKKEQWQNEWDQEKAEIQQKLGELRAEHEDAVFYATMIEYLNRSLGQDLKDDYRE